MPTESEVAPGEKMDISQFTALDLDGAPHSNDNNSYPPFLETKSPHRDEGFTFNTYE